MARTQQGRGGVGRGHDSGGGARAGQPWIGIEKVAGGWSEAGSETMEVMGQGCGRTIHVLSYCHIPQTC